MFFLSGSSEQKPIHFSNPTSQDPVQICKPFCVCVFRAYCIYVEKKKKIFPIEGLIKLILFFIAKFVKPLLLSMVVTTYFITKTSKKSINQ